MGYGFCNDFFSKGGLGNEKFRGVTIFVEFGMDISVLCDLCMGAGVR